MKSWLRGCFILLGVLAAASAFAGTATMDFASSVGLMTYRVNGPGTLTAASGRAFFDGANVTLLANGGNAVYSGGTTRITMTLQASTDAVNGIGLVMFSGGEQLTASIDGNGGVVMTDWIGEYFADQLPYPGAYNSTVGLEYDALTEYATLYLDGTSVGYLPISLNGATSVQVGVYSQGSGGFARLVATGPGIPDYPPPQVDSDGDGVLDNVETAAGTDPNDPGSLPVNNSSGATIHARNNITAVIQAGSLPSSSVNVAVSTPTLIPFGSVPTGKGLSAVGVELKPNGTNFSGPVTVSLPYTAVGILGLVENSLTVMYFNGSGYSSTGISNVTVNPGTHMVSFKTTHFTTFALVGDLYDTDGDGIDDWWEMKWFGNLTTADDTTDYDGDGDSDLTEFRAFGLGVDPKADADKLPVAGPLALAALGLSLAVGGSRRLRRRG